MKHLVVVLGMVGLGVTALPAFARETASSPSTAGTTEEASQRFKRGVALYRDRSFDAALAEFNRAYEISPDYRVLYNIGQVQVERGDYVAALEAFRQFLADGGSSISPQRRTTVEGEIERLEGRVATVQVEGNVEGAELIVDGTSLGTLPMNNVAINAGVRRVLIKKPGFVSVEKELTLTGGETRQLEIQLDAEPVAPTSGVKTATGPRRSKKELQAPPPPKEEDSSLGAGFWVSLIATGAAAGGTAVFAVMTKQADDDYSKELERFPGSPSKIGSARDTYQRNALLTDICGGLTLVGLGATIYFAVSGGSSEPEQPKVGRLSLSTGPRDLGWELTGTF